MSYDGFRQFADSWGLVLMGVLFVTFVGWTMLPGVARAHRHAASSIFEEDLTDD